MSVAMRAVAHMLSVKQREIFLALTWTTIITLPVGPKLIGTHSMLGVGAKERETKQA